jgi:hypothetical protein
LIHLMAAAQCEALAAEYTRTGEIVVV